MITPKEASAMKIRTTYVAPDGKEFAEAEECEAYERANPAMVLVGLTGDDIAGALADPDNDVASAIIRLGYQLSSARRGRKTVLADPPANAETERVTA
jgi:hypothetical protein